MDRAFLTSRFRVHTPQSFQEAAKTAALDVVSKSSGTVTELQATYAKHFATAASLTAVRAQYAAIDLTQPNEPLAAAVDATTDAVEDVLQIISVLEHYVSLTIPKMEDGNNFGVTVQLAALKYMAENKEKINKGLDEVSKYYSSRAEALEKCKLPAMNKTTVVTKTDSESEGFTTEKGDAKSNETKTSTEEKETQTTAFRSPELEYRKQAVTAVDVLHYQKAKALLQTAITGYAMAADFLEKNKEKIAEPKGSPGSGSAFSSMY